MARTENPLQHANEPTAAAPATRAKTVAKKAEGAEANVKKPYVPPPPPDGNKIPPPAGMPAVKTFPISSGPPPNGLKFPGIASAAAPEPAAEGGAPGGEG